MISGYSFHSVLSVLAALREIKKASQIEMIFLKVEITLILLIKPFLTQRRKGAKGNGGKQKHVTHPTLNIYGKLAYQSKAHS